MAQHELNPKDIETAMGAEVEQRPESMEMTPEDLDLSLSGNGVGSEKKKQLMTGQIASARGAGLDSQEIAMAEFEFDQDMALNDAVQDVFTEMEAELTGAGAEALAGSELTPQQIAASLEEGTNIIQELRTSPVATEWAILAKASGDVDLDPDVHREIALQFAMANTVAQLSEEMGWTDKVADFAGMVVPFRDTAAWEQMKGAVRGHPLLSNYITGDSIEGMVNSWQGLDSRRKIALYPVFVQTLIESLGFTIPVPFTSGIKMDSNELQAITMLMRFFQPDGARRASVDQKLFAAIDVIDAGVSAATAAIKMQKIAKLAKTHRMMKQLQDAPITVDTSFKNAAERFTPVVDVQVQAKEAGRAARKQAQSDGFTRKQARDIGKQARKDERAAIFDKMPQQVKIEMEGLMMGMMDRAARQNTIPKLLARAGAKKQAADINIAAMTNPEIAAAYGIRSDDALTNAMPFQTREWMPQAIAGLVPDTAARLNEFLRKAEGKVRSMTTESELFRMGMLTKSERTAAVNTFEQEMAYIGEDMLMEGITLSDVKVLDRAELSNKEAFEFEYTITRTTGATPETFKGRRSWHVSEVTGNYMETALDLVSTSSAGIPGQSPKAWSLGKFNDVVSEAINLNDIKVASSTRIQELWLDANSLVSGITQSRARARIDAIELAGDEFVNLNSAEKGRVFSSRELAAGIHVTPLKKGDPTIIYLTDPKEVETYFRRRMVADAFMGMQNFVTRRELEVLGFKQIAVKIKDVMTPLIARPYESVSQAQAAIRSKKGFQFYNGTTGKVESLNAESVAKMYDDGHVLTRLQEDWNVSGNQQMLGGVHVEFVMTQKGGIHSLPQQVTNYKKGYVPKIMEGVEYVVQQLFPYKKAGGVGGNKTKALRAFASKREADQFIQQMAAKYAAKNNISQADAVTRFQRSDGSVMNQIERMQNNMSGSAGLFTGTRAEDDLLMGLDGVDIKRMSPGEAYGRYMQHLGTQVSTNEWRMAKEQEWITTARDMLPNQRITGYSLKGIDQSTEEGAALARLFNQVQRWNRIPSRKESMYQASVQYFNDWALLGANKIPGVSLRAIPNFLNLKHADVPNAMMTASMHLMLGGVSLAQLFVQSVTSVVALSLRPISEAPGILNDMRKMQMFDNIRDNGVAQKIQKRLAGVTDEEVNMTGDTWDMYQLWLRGGQREAVRSNADMNYMASTGLGFVADTMRKAGNGSLYMYRAGELANRRISFAAAYRWAKETHPTMNFKSDEFLSKVLSRSNLTMLELNGAQRAFWQGGQGATAGQKILQVATQFLQVGAKTAELALKGEKRGGFTLREKGRILLGQAVFFGSAGVPPLAWFGKDVVKGIADGLGLDENNPEDLESIKSIANTYNQGLIGLIAKEGFGANIKLSGRTAILNSVAGTVWDILTAEDPQFIRMLGVSGVWIERGEIESNQIKSDIDLAISETLKATAVLEPYAFGDRSGMIEMDHNMMLAVASSIGHSFTQIFSSTRSMSKAILMHNHDVIMSQNGTVKIAKDFSWGTEIGVAMGFQTIDEADLFITKTDRKDMENLVRDVSDILVRDYHDLKFVHDNDPGMAEKLRLKVQFLQERLGNPWMREKLRQSLTSRLKDNPQTEQEREMSEYFLRHMHNEITNATMIDQGLGDTLLGKGAVVLPFADQAIKNSKEEEE